VGTEIIGTTEPNAGGGTSVGSQSRESGLGSRESGLGSRDSGVGSLGGHPSAVHHLIVVVLQLLLVHSGMRTQTSLLVSIVREPFFGLLDSRCPEEKGNTWRAWLQDESARGAGGSGRTSLSACAVF
jgi:hypothetical protein